MTNRPMPSAWQNSNRFDVDGDSVVAPNNTSNLINDQQIRGEQVLTG